MATPENNKGNSSRLGPVIVAAALGNLGSLGFASAFYTIGVFHARAFRGVRLAI